jgi:hypothetical protein
MRGCGQPEKLTTTVLQDHVPSISGYHMVVVAGVVFSLTRGILALIPGFALRHPIKN